MSGTDCVYVGIGNSDDKLSQERWSEFTRDIVEACYLAGRIIGVWYSEPSSRFQNACVCAGPLKPGKQAWLRKRLAELAGLYGQEAVSWAVAETEMIRGE